MSQRSYWGPVDITHLHTVQSEVTYRSWMVQLYTVETWISSKSRDRGFVSCVLQAAKEVVASPMQDQSNVDLVKSVKAAKRPKAAA